MADIITCPVSRPYANRAQRRAAEKGKPRMPSVTEVQAVVIHKQGLMWAWGDELLDFLRRYPDKLDDPSVRSHPRGVWDRRAVIGTAVHAVNAAWAFGREADVETAVRDALTNKSGELRKGYDEDAVAALALEAMPYVDALERFWDEWQPEWRAVEHVVRHDDRVNSYIGQSDGAAKLADGAVHLLDFKSTANPKMALYPSEWRTQLAAYRWAESIVLYDNDGNETGTMPNLTVDAAAVVQLRFDGTYAFVPMQAGRSEHTRFLQMRNVWTWLTQESNKPECVAVDPPGALAEALEKSLQEVGA